MDYAIAILSIELFKLKTDYMKLQARYGSQATECRLSEFHQLIRNCEKAISILEGYR